MGPRVKRRMKASATRAKTGARMAATDMRPHRSSCAVGTRRKGTWFPDADGSYAAEFAERCLPCPSPQHHLRISGPGGVPPNPAPARRQSRPAALLHTLLPAGREICRQARDLLWGRDGDRDLGRDGSALRLQRYVAAHHQHVHHHRHLPDGLPHPEQPEPRHGGAPDQARRADRAHGRPRNALLDLEDLDEETLEKLRADYARLADMARGEIGEGADMCAPDRTLADICAAKAPPPAPARRCGRIRQSRKAEPAGGPTGGAAAPAAKTGGVAIIPVIVRGGTTIGNAHDTLCP